MAEPWTTSGLITSSQAITTRPALIHSVCVFSDGTNVATGVIYDNTGAAGTIAAKVQTAGNAAAPRSTLLTSESGIICNTGIYLVTVGTGCEVIVHYSLL